MSKMTNEELEIHVLSQLILEYRASLGTMSKMFNMSPSDVYKKVMGVNNDLIKKALLFVLDYETNIKNEDIQNEAKRNIRLFLIKLHQAKNGSEKVRLIKNLDNEEEIKKIKVKKGLGLTTEEVDTVIKYRYKYALSRLSIQDKLGIDRHVLERREKNLDDNMQKKLLRLNEFNEDFYMKKRHSLR